MSQISTKTADFLRYLERYRRSLWLAAVLAFVLLAALARFSDLGTASLWGDEFCTWHVSRMPIGESLRWGPELTKPPLYQFCLRALTHNPHPSEWMLRLPAAIAGILIIPAIFWLGARKSAAMVGFAAAALLAIDPFQIHLSQLARPYTMLLLGAILSTALWYQLVLTNKRLTSSLYVLAVTLTFHANYLIVLTLIAHVAWLAYVALARRSWRLVVAPTVCLCISGLLCIPIVSNYLVHRESMFQGLSWIKPMTLVGAIEILGKIAYGNTWIGFILAPALVLWSASIVLSRRRQTTHWTRRIFVGPEDICSLLLIWLFCAWFGLAIISLLFHAAMVDRYAVPAAVPALLFPLVILNRIKGQMIPIVLLVFLGIGFRNWEEQIGIDPGFREMVGYLSDTMDRQHEIVVLAVNRQLPSWDEAERLLFQYYPLPGVSIHELPIAMDGVTVLSDILNDPRPMYLVALWSDPFPILERAGRTTELIRIEGEEFTQLNFRPYRLIKVAGKN